MSDWAERREQEIQARALTTVDEDMVERGARALWGSGDIDDEEWRSLRECTREHYRADARFVLDAALGRGEGS